MLWLSLAFAGPDVALLWQQADQVTLTVKAPVEEREAAGIALRAACEALASAEALDQATVVQEVLRAGDVEKTREATRVLQRTLLTLGGIEPVPTTPIDRVRGAEVYSKECAICHGPAGDGKGMMGRGLRPAPVDFTDRTRARERSVYSLFNTVSVGRPGTAMAAYPGLSEADRWNVAAYAGGFAFPDAGEGKKLQRKSGQLASLADWATVPPSQMVGPTNEVDAVVGHVRHHPPAK